MQQTTATPTLSGAVGIPSNIRGMGQDDLDMTRALLDVWRAKYPRNLLRSAFYDAKQRFRNLQIAVQSDLGRKHGRLAAEKRARALRQKRVRGF